jgi:hypothetical protein
MYQEIEGQRPVVISRNHNARARPPIYRWTMPPDYDPAWNQQRSLYTGLFAGIVGATYAQVSRPVFDLLRFYQAPDNFKQLSLFTKEVVKMDTFRQGFLGRLGFYTAYGLIFETARWTMWKNITCGYPYYRDMVNVAFVKHFLTAGAVGALTSWIPVPFHNIMVRYNQDQILPREFARGYKSPLHAAFQIVKQDGLYPLVRSGGPLMAENTLNTMMMFYMVDFLKDKARVLKTQGFDHEMTPDWMTKPIYVFFGAMAGLFSGFGVRSLRMAVEEHPKNAKGELLFGSYAEATWRGLGDSFQMHQLWTGFVPYFCRAGPPLMATIWFADSIGLLDQVVFDPSYVD